MTRAEIESKKPPERAALRILEGTILGYCISRLTCLCSACGTDFEEFIPTNYELVQFQCGDGKNRYLPAYGKDGYLDLLTKLVPEWDPKQTITKAVSKQFCERLSKVCGCQIELFGRSKLRCPYCGAKEVSVSKEDIVPDFPVEWLKVPGKLDSFT